ncbi:hypothetical protein AltI4_31010 [Alteromonas sp. I4]|nr:hypothetical protein AltI4_31010 [Alteromonas sp. I4]
MIHQPALRDIYYDQERREFRLDYYDGLQALLNPIKRCPNEQGQFFNKDEFEKQVRCGLLTPQYCTKHESQTLTQHQIKEIQKRRPYIVELEALVAKGHPPTTAQTLSLLKKNVHDKHHIGTKKHGNSTIAKWWKQYKDADYYLESSVEARKPQPKRVDTANENYLNAYCSDHWVKSGAENIAAGYSQYNKAIESAQSQNKSLKSVSYSTFVRRIKAFNEFKVILNSGNYSAIKKALRTLCKKIQTQRVLERVEMDRMSLNLALIDENGEPTGNVSVYIAIDCYSRYPVSVTFELGTNEDTEGTVRSFKRIFEQSSEQLCGHGIPMKVVVDNGAGYKSEAFKQVVQRTGCDLIKAPSNEPWRKPFVESFIGILRKEFFEGVPLVGPDGRQIIGIPGYKGKRTSNTTKPPSENSIKKAASLDVNDFACLLHQYLFDYVNQPHSGLNGKTPQQVWNKSIAEYPLIPVNYEQLYLACHYKEATPKLGERGTVQVDKQIFADQRLKHCYLEAKTLDKKQNMSVTVKYDPDDARWVTVIADFPSYDTPRIFEKVENHALSEEELETTISFEQLNEGHSGSVQRREITTIQVDRLYNQKTKHRSSGKAVESAKKNESRELSAKEKIQQSNNNYAHRATNKPNSSRQIPDDKTSKSYNSVNSNLRNEQQTFQWDD